MMRTFLVFALAMLIAIPASAATLQVKVTRNGFSEPMEIALAPRVDGRPPQWSATRTLSAKQSSATFDGLEPGLYVVLARGPRPLQRLSTKANVGSTGATIQIVIPEVRTELRATVGGEPIPRAEIVLTHDELRWQTDVHTNDEGRFAGELWEPAVYTAGVRPHSTSAPHNATVWLSEKPVTIDVPDRHVTGRVVANGKPLAGAVVNLRSENTQSTLTMRTQTAPDGRFEFFGVREGALTLTARATSYLDSDPIELDLRGNTSRNVDVELLRGEPRNVRIVNARNEAIAGATLIASCNGHVKSTAITNSDGTADVALPASATTCAIFALPKEGSIAIEPVGGTQPLHIRVREATSSLRLALKSDAGEAFSSMSLLLRIDGIVVPPAIARIISNRGFPLVTDDDGAIALARIPPGTYEFWPYRNSAEGQMLYETAAEFDAPISVKVLTGENNATVRFATR